MNLRDLMCGVLVSFLATGPSGQSVVASASSEDKAPEIAGTWTWSWDDSKGVTHRHTLEIEGTGSKWAGRERFDDEAPVRVTEIKSEGKKVHFVVVRGAHRAEYSGVIDKSDRINGTVTTTDGGESQESIWKAERKRPAVQAPSC